MFLDLINWEKLKRGVLYGVYLLIVLGVQHLLLAHVAVLDVRAMILPVAVVAVGLFEGGMWGGVFGLFAGLFGDMIFAENTVIFTVLFPVAGFFSGMLAEFVMNKSFMPYFFLSLAALILTAAVQMLRVALIGNLELTAIFTAQSFLPLLKTAGLQVLWSLPFSVPLYFPCRALGRRRPKT